MLSSAGDGLRARRSNALLLTIAVAIACAVFTWIGYWRVVNPLDLGWMFHEDPFTHAIGWEHFRNAPLLQYPLTRNETFGLEWSSSLVFSDSIPLVGLVLKPFSGWLPRPFQYIGAWALVSVVLQAFWAMKLVMLRTTRLAEGVIGGVLFAIAPVLLERVGLQSALGSHWLVLWALWLYVTALGPAHRRWGILLLIAAGVHAYMLVMCGGIWIAHLAACRQHDVLGSRDYGMAVVTLVAVVMWMHALGYFMVGATGGIWRSRFDLAGFVAPSLGARLGVLPSVYDAVWDGSAYLGAGVLLLIGTTTIGWAARRRSIAPGEHAQVSWGPLVVVLAFTMLFAITNEVTVLNRPLVTAPLPNVLDRLYAAFRGGNRMIWPAYYVLLLGAIWWTMRVWSRRASLVALAAAAAIQIVDLDGMAAIKRVEARGIPLVQPLTDEVWPVIARHYQRIVSVPSSWRQPEWPTLSWFAAQHGLATNVVYVNRFDWKSVTRATDERSIAWRTGQLEAGTVYFFPNAGVWSLAVRAARRDDLAVVADGMHLILPDGRRWLPRRATATVSADVPWLGTWLEFGAESMRGLLLSGWSWCEWWGIWSDGHAATLVLPVPEHSRVRVTFKWRARASRGHLQHVTLQLGDQSFEVEFPGTGEREDSFVVTTSTGLLDARMTIAYPVRRRSMMPFGVARFRQIGVGLTAARVEKLDDEQR